MAIPSAPEPEEVSSALRRRLAGRFPGEVTDAEAPTRISGGLDFWVYGLHFAGPGLPEQWGAPLVARIAARAWARNQFWRHLSDLPSVPGR